jgi:hypothetical protein
MYGEENSFQSGGFKSGGLWRVLTGIVACVLTYLNPKRIVVSLVPGFWNKRTMFVIVKKESAISKNHFAKRVLDHIRVEMNHSRPIMNHFYPGMDHGFLFFHHNMP